MLATKGSNNGSLSRAFNKSSDSGASPVSRAAPVSILTTEKSNATAPIIRQLPARFYKGIIETMKRKRLKNLGPAVQSNHYYQY